MARFTFKLPDIGEGISEAEIVAWHVAIGDRVEEDQQIADMMTDKATVEMESPVSGTVIEGNPELGDDPSLVNTDPEGEGWFFKIGLSDVGELEDLMDETAYEAFVSKL